MRRVLFVDDEPQILEALRDALHKQRHRWDMVFCTSGADALRQLSLGRFDVVVTDMRMPGMDGAELLGQVKRLYPATIRMVLSGQADRELVLRMLTVAQQFLSKPCGVDRLRTVIDRALDLRSLLDDPVLLALVGELDTLPSVPSSYVQLTDALATGNAGVSEISSVVEKDAALSAKLLQIVNSAYFGLSHPVLSVPAAVNYLGIEMIKALSLMVGIFSTVELRVAASEFSMERAQREALMVAQLSRRIVRDRSRRDEAFTTGVLHDVGKLILALRLPKRYGAALREAATGHRALHAIELELIGATHASVGAMLLGSWGLPLPIVQSVAYHHDMHPGDHGDDAVTLAVHVADALVSAILNGTPDDAALDLQTLEQLGLLGAIDEWRAAAFDVVNAVAE